MYAQEKVRYFNKHDMIYTYNSLIGFQNIVTVNSNILIYMLTTYIKIIPIKKLIMYEYILFIILIIQKIAVCPKPRLIDISKYSLFPSLITSSPIFERNNHFPECVHQPFPSYFPKYVNFPKNYIILIGLFPYIVKVYISKG